MMKRCSKVRVRKCLPERPGYLAIRITSVRISGVQLYKYCCTVFVDQMMVPIVFAQAVVFLTFVR
jgi:hypothetical protein